MDWHDQCVHISFLHTSWLTFLVMILGELCNFAGARPTTLFSKLRQLITFYKAYAFVEALVVVRHFQFVKFACFLL